MIFAPIFSAAIAVAIRVQREQQDAEVAERRSEFEAYRTLGELALRTRMHAPRLKEPAACNCRNCGAPFEPSETQCSYCRSER